MELIFFYPRWGSANISWPLFLEKVKKHGYQGIELSLPLDKQEKAEVLAILADFELKHVGQHYETKEVDFKKHKESYKRHLYNLLESDPILVNTHTGMDFFSFAQNAELLELAEKMENESGVPITHETHRSRFGFAPHICFDYLIELPFLKLTADFAHWTCVAETLLENQEIAVQKAIERTYHMHMRVGSTQSSQVQDPRDNNYASELDRFVKWWLAMIENAKKVNRPFFTILPEHGPFPYGIYHKDTKNPIEDQWEVNQFIKSKILTEWENIKKFQN